MKYKLEHVIQVSASGTEHPYYSASPTSSDAYTMLQRVISYPPLDHVTTVPITRAYVDFLVILETEWRDVKWEVDVWHNLSNEHQWSALRLVPSGPRPFHSGLSGDDAHHRNWYSGRLEGSSERPVSFTIRFRNAADQGWRWVHDDSGAQDGHLIYQRPTDVVSEINDLSHYIDALAPSLDIQRVNSDVPHTTLWSINSTVAPAQGDNSGYSMHVLGTPKLFMRWFSLVRLWAPWLAPRQGKNFPLANEDAILYSFLRKDGLHVVTLAISGIDDVLTVFRHDGSKITVNSRNEREEHSTVRLAVAVGNTFEDANAAVMYHARKIVGEYGAVTPELKKITEPETKDDRALHASWFQDWYDGFNFCTWNSLGQNLTEDKIFDALDSLHANGVKITNLLIDDNWQQLDNEGESQMIRGWVDFEANPKAFPNGLKSTVTKLRHKYPNIKHVCVWHALFGYWGGISPTGRIAEKYKTIQVEKDDGRTITVVDSSDVERMYDDFYSFLLASGVDSVKTDAQFFLDKLRTAPARRSLTLSYLSTWMAAQLRHFSGHAISCMSQTPQILFSCQVPMESTAIPVRNSDDFFPEIDASHPWHIFCNAHNALMAQHLNVLPDWDMFQTLHKWSGFHAAARCVSGGPIYITDEPRKHDTGLISSMTAATVLGQSIILRPSVVGKSADVYIGYEEERFCKIGAFDGHAGTGSSFLGVFNCREIPITEVVSLKQFRGIEKDRRYVIKQHHSRTAYEILGMLRLEHDVASSLESPSEFGVNLPGHGWVVFTATPLYGPYFVSEELKDITLSNIGLLGKITGAAAILKTDISVVSPNLGDTPEQSNISPFAGETFNQARLSHSRLRIQITLKALGVLGIFVPKIEEIDWMQHTLALIEGKPIPPNFARKNEVSWGLLELDIESAWKYLNLESGSSNEVDVQVFLM